MRAMLGIRYEAEVVQVTDYGSPDHSLSYLDQVARKCHGPKLGRVSSRTTFMLGTNLDQEQLFWNDARVHGGSPEDGKGKAQLLLALLQQQGRDAVWTRGRVSLELDTGTLNVDLVKCDPGDHGHL